MEIAPGVHRLGTEYVNWYVVEDGGRLTAVDAGVPAFAETLEADLEGEGLALDDVAALVLTHSDADHTGIAARLRDAGARVLIHADDEATLAKPRAKGGDASPIHLVPRMWRPQLWRTFLHLARRGAMRPPKVEGAETFAGGDVLDVPGSPRAVPTPGHTPGHCVFLFEGRGALFVGDALCTWNPLTGATGPQLMPPPLNTSNERALASLDALDDLEAEWVLPGHGDPWRGAPAEAAARAREERSG